MNAAKLKGKTPIRMLITGYPGTAKTGSLASLANAGYKLRVLDFDGNPESLLQYTKRQFLPNIDILSFEDKVVDKGNYLGPSGLPMAFTNALRAMDQWKYEDPDGVLDPKTGKRWNDLGSSATWGLDTIVVCDGLTGLGDACMNRARAMMNKTPLTMSQPVWGLAIQDQLNFLKRLTAASNPHHTIVISHLKIVGPKTEGSQDTDLQKTVKQEQSDLIPSKLCPTALGWGLPQTIAGEFPIVVNLSVEAKGNKMVRRFNVHPQGDMDLKLPVKDIAALGELGVEDGLHRIFLALGQNDPVPAMG